MKPTLSLIPCPPRCGGGGEAAGRRPLWPSSFRLSGRSPRRNCQKMFLGDTAKTYCCKNLKTARRLLRKKLKQSGDDFVRTLKQPGFFSIIHWNRQEMISWEPKTARWCSCENLKTAKNCFHELTFQTVGWSVRLCMHSSRQWEIGMWLCVKVLLNTVFLEVFPKTRFMTKWQHILQRSKIIRVAFNTCKSPHLIKAYLWAFLNKSLVNTVNALVRVILKQRRLIADLQISKSPIGPTKKSGEAL